MIIMYFNIFSFLPSHISVSSSVPDLFSKAYFPDIESDPVVAMD